MDEWGVVNYVLRHDEVEWLNFFLVFIADHIWAWQKRLEGGICCIHIHSSSFWKSCSVTERSSTLRRLNEFRLPGTCLKNWTISVISKKKKKEKKTRMIGTWVLVSSVRTGHRYGYSKESLYQHSPVQQAVSSLVHEGLVLHLVGKQSQENRVLPLIEAEKGTKQITIQKCVALHIISMDVIISMFSVCTLIQYSQLLNWNI